MSPETESKKTKLCPTCGTRLSESATRCLVCRTDLTSGPAQPALEGEPSARPLQAVRMPSITLSLPAALAILLITLLFGAGVVFGVLRATNRVVDPTPQPTPSLTPTITPTPTETGTPTPTATATELPPFDYTVAPGDVCSSIAYTFNISVQSIIILNNLDVNCTLRVGQVLKIPYPTATPLPPPTRTLEPAEATRAACLTARYTVQANDTLSSIAANYNVPMEAIRVYNNLPTDTVLLGTTLIIPLCERLPAPGQPTPTPTPPPPYPAPSLLLPVDGAAFTLAHDIVTLQWASLGTLREGEFYQVIVEDVTAGEGRRIVDYVTDTKYIVPTSFRPNDNVAHVIRWWVTPVRRVGTDDEGQPIYVPAGASSDKRVFTWTGAATGP